MARQAATGIAIDTAAGSADASSLLLAELRLVREQMTALRAEVTRRDDPHFAARAATPEPRLGVSAALEGRIYATFLGTFALYRDHSPVALGRTRSVQLLCRFLFSRPGHPVSRDELLELLWPQSEDERAAHRLHTAVSSLRRLIDHESSAESAILLDVDSYCVARDAIVTDCELFDQLYARARRSIAQGDTPSAASAFRSALELYGGEYLADQPYAEWTHVARAHFAARQLNALTFLCDFFSEVNPLLSIEYAQQILEIDNLNERAYRQHMRALYQMGQRATALQQFQQCVQVLSRELGIGPSRTTRDVYLALRDDMPPPAERTGPA